MICHAFSTLVVLFRLDHTGYLNGSRPKGRTQIGIVGLRMILRLETTRTVCDYLGVRVEDLAVYAK